VGKWRFDGVIARVIGTPVEVGVKEQRVKQLNPVLANPAQYPNYVNAGSYTDAVGNPGVAAASPVLRVDTVAPTMATSTNGATINVASNGNTSAFSASTVSLGTTVNEVNSATGSSTYAGNDLRDHRRIDGFINSKDDQRLLALSAPTDLHARDVDIGVSQDSTQVAHHSGSVSVGEERNVLSQEDVQVEAIDFHDLFALTGTGQGSCHGHQRAIGKSCLDPNHVLKVRTVRRGRQRNINALFGGQQRCVDIRHGLIAEVGE
jgi:hypothetical protein